MPQISAQTCRLAFCKIDPLVRAAWLRPGAPRRLFFCEQTHVRQAPTTPGNLSASGTSIANGTGPVAERVSPAICAARAVALAGHFSQPACTGTAAGIADGKFAGNWPVTTRERRKVAIHEASHCAVAMSLGAHVASLSICEPTGGVAGIALPENRYHRLLIYSAGEIAEFEFSEFWYLCDDKNTDDSDNKQSPLSTEKRQQIDCDNSRLLATIAEHGGSTDELEFDQIVNGRKHSQYDFYRHCRKELFRLFDRHHDQVVALAERLLELGAMDHAEIMASWQTSRHCDAAEKWVGTSNGVGGVTDTRMSFFE